MFMFSLSAFKHLLNPVSVLFTWQLLFQESAAIVCRGYQADACMPLCRNASSSALIWFFKVEPKRSRCSRFICSCEGKAQLPFSCLSSSRDPLADICWAILERDVVRFAALEKTDRVLIHEGEVF